VAAIARTGPDHGRPAACLKRAICPKAEGDADIDDKHLTNIYCRCAPIRERSAPRIHARGAPKMAQGEEVIGPI